MNAQIDTYLVSVKDMKERKGGTHITRNPSITKLLSQHCDNPGLTTGGGTGVISRKALWVKLVLRCIQQERIRALSEARSGVGDVGEGVVVGCVRRRHG